MSEYAAIHLLDTAIGFDDAYDYYIPPDLRRDILCGDFVAVPFGNGNRKKIGVVVELRDKPQKHGIRTKPVLSVCDKTISLTPEALGLAFFIKEQTICTLGDAVRAIVPTSVLAHIEEIYSINPQKLPEKELGDKEREIYEYLKKHGRVGLKEILAKFDIHAVMPVQNMFDEQLLIREHDIVYNAKEKQIEHYSLKVSKEEAADVVNGKVAIKLRSKKHAEILRFFIDSGTEDSIDARRITDACAATRAQLVSLCDKGLLKKEAVTVDRSLGLISTKQEVKEIILNDEQQAALDKLTELFESGQPHGVLLHGVTGSGKTSVMIKMIDRVLEAGRGVIVLLPEIALTPQSLAIFCSRYGDRVAIIHSGLSVGERFDTFRRIKNGGADVVIGTRSAVFAPLSDVGLIIIDEEQEHTYKSDMNPKYHTRDVARYRCAHHKGIMLLASATPSFESYKKALDGGYTLIELNHRYGGAKLPVTEIDDMRTQTKLGNVSPLGQKLCERLAKNMKNKDQSILFINRRGYNNFVSCQKCGESVKCPSCSVSMTYHTTSARYDKGYLACHWCGKKMPLPEACPSCSDEHLARIGYGTQRVEQELSMFMPETRILRMDTDTTGEKSSYEELLGAFRRHEADILLGTQMVTKGHDFPDVTLVGVLLADASLYLDDFRAAERTFAMLTQVIGRAGRSKKSGVAVIQTNNPDNECIRFACAQDYKGFYQSEIRLRKLLVFPPFCDIALLTLTSLDEQMLARASTMLSEKLSELMKGEYADLPLVVFGPFEAPVYKVENKFRMRMVIKCRANKRCRAMLTELLVNFCKLKSVTLSVDINPTNI